MRRVIIGISLLLIIPGCSSNKSPEARFTFTPERPTTDQAVYFDGTDSQDPDGQIVGSDWFFSDGSQAHGLTATHVYTQAGTYEVTLTVTDDKGAQDSAQRIVTVAANQSVASIPAPGHDPQGLAWDGTSLWNVDTEGLTLYQLDPADGRARKSFELAAELPTGLAWDGQSFWLLDTDALRLDKLDPNTGRSLGRGWPAPSKLPWGLAWDGQNLWVSDLSEAKLYQVNPATGRVSATVPAPGPTPVGLTWDGAHLWIADQSGKLYELDLESGQVLRVLVSPGEEPTGLSWDGENLWVADAQELKIYKIKP